MAVLGITAVSAVHVTGEFSAGMATVWLLLCFWSAWLLQWHVALTCDANLPCDCESPIVAAGVPAVYSAPGQAATLHDGFCFLYSACQVSALNAVGAAWRAGLATADVVAATRHCILFGTMWPFGLWYLRVCR